MAQLLVFNKPFNVLCQFTDEQGRATLKDYIPQPGIYPAGRLDLDSEGLLLLTDDGALQHRIAHPSQKLPKTYWVQVEGEVHDMTLKQLQQGVTLNDGPTRPAKVERIDAPQLWPRTPPVRSRREIPTCWLAITLSEGRNRQVRRMTAAVEHPTLRLVRVAIGPWQLGDLQPGQMRTETVHLPQAKPPIKTSTKGHTKQRRGTR
ncbi:MAG TPA: pseudouridine synthase [Cellvibrionaceae bacterium]